MAGRAKRTVQKPIDYTRYEYDPEKLGRSPDFDPQCLEETSAGPMSEELIDYIEQEFPGSIGDSDGDGYIEVDKFAVEIAAAELGMKGPFPLAPLFLDRPGGRSEHQVMNDLVRLVYGDNSNRFGYLPTSTSMEIFNSIVQLDFRRAARAFASFAARQDNPLERIAPILECMLENTGVHVDQSIGAISGLPEGAHLNQTSGFSVDNRGRLRIDCKIFAELAYVALKAIPGLTFNYVNLVGRRKPRVKPLSIPNFFGTGDNSQGHRLLLVSDGKGRNIRVDNDSVTYYESDSPTDGFRERYHCSFDAAYMREVGAKGGWSIVFKRNPYYKGDDGCGMKVEITNVFE